MLRLLLERHREALWWSIRFPKRAILAQFRVASASLNNPFLRALVVDTGSDTLTAEPDGCSGLVPGLTPLLLARRSTPSRPLLRSIISSLPRPDHEFRSVACGGPSRSLLLWPAGALGQ